MFRNLKAEEIECRVAQATAKGVSLLLYKDARCDQAILDETVGAKNWQRHHTRDNANCVVSIWDGDKQMWIEKEDTGTESNTEKEKGLASDSFKRACFNWGIGRELYTSPFIWIKAEDCVALEQNQQGKWQCRDKFSVLEIKIESKRITHLIVVNDRTGKACFVWSPKPSANETPTPKFVPPVKPEPEQTPAPKFVPPDLKFRCDECGADLKPYSDKTGKQVGIRRHAERSKEMFDGKVLCLECIDKRAKG